MLPYISLTDTEFTPLVTQLKTIFHGKYFIIPEDWRIILLCGKSIDPLKGGITTTRPLKNFLKALNPFKYSFKGQAPTNREILLEYAREKDARQKYFFAEKILHDDFDKSGLDLLRGEKQLADIVDCIFIFLESWGTAAELGAFAINKDLCEKILVVNDLKYKDDNSSFISKGPLKLVNKESKYKQTFYCNTADIHKSLPEIESIISSIEVGKVPRIHLPIKNYSKQPPKAWLFLICDLLRVVQPIDIASFHYIANEIIGNIHLSYFYAILNIAINIDLIGYERYGDQKLYSIGDETSKFGPFIKIKEEETNQSRILMSTILKDNFPDFYDRWSTV